MREPCRVVAILSAFNEADVIAAVLEHLREQDVDSYLIDDRSTDGTAEVAREFLGRGLLGIETFGGSDPGTFDWAGILRRKEQLARELEADWFLHHDADEMRDGPWPGTTLREAIELVDRLGYNAIEFRVFNFPPIDDGFCAGDDPRRYFIHYEEAAEYDQLQIKCWKAQPGGVVLAQGGHEARFADRRVFPIHFPLRHYPLRGQAHARRKVFEERKPRFTRAERANGWHVQYDRFTDEGHRFLREPDTLKPFDLDRVRVELLLDNGRARDLERRLREAAMRSEDAERVRAERDLLERQQHELAERASAERENLERRHRELAVEHARHVEAAAGEHLRFVDATAATARDIERLQQDRGRFEEGLAASRREQELLEALLEDGRRAQGRLEALLEDGRREQARLEALLEDERRERTRLERRLLAVVDMLPDAPPDAHAKAIDGAGSAYGLDAGQDVGAYRDWIGRANHPVAAASSGAIRFDVIVRRPPETDTGALEASLDSLRAQSYDAWDLIAAEAGEARGDFILTLDAGDKLAPDALSRIAEAITEDREADVLFTDEDEIDDHGLRSSPHFKPGWSPDLLLSMPYLGRLLVLRRALVEKIGVRISDCEEYDLALRATEQARRVVHVAAILYHRRAGAAPRASTDAAALRDALARRGEPAEVAPGLLEGSFHVRRRSPRKPLVSIIVPFRDGAALLERCIGSIPGTAGYENFEVLLVDNASWEPETHMTLRALARDSRMRVLHDPSDFNWSNINNRAVESAKGELLLFMNSDVEGLAVGWLSEMVEHALRPEVGPVGARLLYPDGRVQHAGVIVGFGGRAEHAFRFCPGESTGYRGLAKLTRNCAAVTGACLMVRRSVYEELGGFDASFAVAFNDVDFCMRARKAGYLVVYTPHAELVHHESATRGVSTDDEEAKALVARWGSVVAADPYFNPNLSRWRAEFALPRASERAP